MKDFLNLVEIDDFIRVKNQLHRYWYPQPVIEEAFLIAVESGFADIVILMINEEWVDPSFDQNYPVYIAGKTENRQMLQILMDDDRVYYNLTARQKRFYHDLIAAQRKRCGSILISLDNKILVVKERSYPIDVRKFGFNKGSYRYGETYSDCLSRELFEELGISLDKIRHHVLETEQSGQSGGKFMEVIRLLVRSDQVKITLGSELVDYRWMTYDELKEDFDRHPGQYNRSFRENFERALRYAQAWKAEAARKVGEVPNWRKIKK